MKAAFKPTKSKNNNGVMEYFFRNGQALYLQRPKLVFIPLEVFQSDNISLTNILINIFPISVNNPHLIYVIPILAAALYLLQAMNSRRPIKSCVCSLGFVIDQIGGIKTTKQRYVIIAVSHCFERFAGRRKLSQEPVALELWAVFQYLSIFSKASLDLRHILFYLSLTLENKLSRMHATSGTNALSTMY